MSTWDVAVVGLGAVGSATTLHLAAGGARVLGLDRFRPPHGLGSSHGDTRITRLAVGEGDAFVPLVRRSHELWRVLEEDLDEALYVACGGVVLGRPGATGQHGVDDFVAATIGIARRHGIAHEVLSGDELRARLPTFELDEEVAYFEPSAGYLRPEACLRAQLAGAERAGAELRVDTAVRAIRSTPRGVALRTDDGTIEAGSVVVAAGAWCAALLPQLAPLLDVEREVLFWLDLDDGGHAAAWERAPIFIWLHGEGPTELMYGFPAVDGRDGGVKLATESFGRPTSPDVVRRDVDGREVAEFHRAHVAGRLRGVSERSQRTEVCLYTVTPDFGFVVDEVDEHGRVLVASACSGHGFKHSAALGEAIAQRVLGRPATVDLAPFAISRLR